tara:strand:- start:1281 stop:1766 length:486 start_codon:yes stop_codon:yes gene_type:complete
MMKPLLKTILLLTTLLSTGAWTDESPFKISVETLMTKASSTGDASYLSMASLRCAALLNTYLTLGATYTDATNDGTVTQNLFKLGVTIAAQKMTEHGAEQKMIDMIWEKAEADLQSDSLKYWEWLKDNKETTGDYFSTAPTFQRELEQCNMLYSMGQPNSN